MREWREHRPCESVLLRRCCDRSTPHLRQSRKDSLGGTRDVWVAVVLFLNGVAHDRMACQEGLVPEEGLGGPGAEDGPVITRGDFHCFSGFWARWCGTQVTHGCL